MAKILLWKSTFHKLSTFCVCVCLCVYVFIICAWKKNSKQKSRECHWGSDCFFCFQEKKPPIVIYRNNHHFFSCWLCLTIFFFFVFFLIGSTWKRKYQNYKPGESSNKYNYGTKWNDNGSFVLFCLIIISSAYSSCCCRCCCCFSFKNFSLFIQIGYIVFKYHFILFVSVFCFVFFFCYSWNYGTISYRIIKKIFLFFIFFLVTPVPHEW